jgi:hypothetical protein
MDRQEGNLTFLVTSCRIGQSTYEITRELPSKIYKGTRIAMIATNCLLLLSTILLNAVSVMAIRKSSQLKKKICYFVVLIQSVVDLGVGILSIPVFIYCILTPFLYTINCTFVVVAYGTTFIPCGISIITLSVMTFERYIAIFHPFSYKTKVTKKRIFVFVLVGAVIFISMFFLSSLDRRIFRNFCTGIIPVFVFITVYIYTKIYRLIRKLVRSEKRPGSVCAENQNLARKQVFRDCKHAKSCFLVVICFGISLLPLTLGSVLFKVESLEYQEYLLWCHTLLIFNSSANSLIFFWTKTQLRNEALQNLNCFSSRSS